MRRISFLLSRRDERGATALMIAIMVPTVFLGIGAIVVNVGSWYVARGMDQNGADAAALAVAISCADGTCDPAEADQYANASSNGQLAGQATIVCGTAPGLTACDPAIEGGQICPAANDAPYVDVLVAPAGGSMENFTGGTQSVAACAQATLDAVGSCEDCVAFTISQCEWELNTDGGFAQVPESGSYSNGNPPSYLDTINSRRTSGLFTDKGTNIYDAVTDPQSPQGSSDIAGSETVLFTHGSDTTDAGCGAAGNGANAPGQFGWLDDPDDDCTAVVNDDSTIGEPGNSVNTNCEGTFIRSRGDEDTPPTPIYIPVYSAYGESGPKEYTIVGFAAFVVTGWELQGKFGPQSSSVAAADTTSGFTEGKSAAYCGHPAKKDPKKGGFTFSNSDICISGYFTEALAPPGTFGGGGSVNLGLTVPSLSG